MLFLKSCAVCSRIGKQDLCPSCAEKFKSSIAEMKMKIMDGKYDLYFLTYYSAVSQKVIKAYKFKVRRSLASTIASAFSPYFAKRDNSATLFAPLPSSKKGLRQRGFNQVEQVLKCFSGIKCENIFQISKKHKRDVQKSFDRQKRFEHSKGKFIADFPAEILNGIEKIVVVDDVYTTGATISSAITALEEFLTKTGADIKIEALVFAKGGFLLEKF